MKILYITQNYTPDIGAAANRATDLSKNLQDLGNSITIITSTPYYLRKKPLKKYQNHFFFEEKIGKVNIIRCKTPLMDPTSKLSRLKNYFSFTTTSFIAALTYARGKYDIIYITSPPLFIGPSGYFLSKIKRAKFVLEIRDLWPKSVFEYGFLKSKTLHNLGKWLESFTYRRANAIVGVTEDINQHISKIVPKTPVYLIRNGVNLDIIKRAKTDKLKKTLKLDKNFMVLYAGLLGYAQGLETVLAAAKELEKEKDIMFVFIGDGPKKEESIELSKSLGLKNTLFLDAVPRNEISKYMSLADIALVPLRSVELGKGTLPGKLFDNLGIGNPVVSNLPGEAKDILEESGGGKYVKPKNPQLLAKTILNLKNNPKKLKEMSEKGKTYAKEHFDRKNQAKKLNEILETLK